MCTALRRVNTNDKVTGGSASGPRAAGPAGPGPTALGSSGASLVSWWGSSTTPLVNRVGFDVVGDQLGVNTCTTAVREPPTVSLDRNSKLQLAAESKIMSDASGLLSHSAHGSFITLPAILVDVHEYAVFQRLFTCMSKHSPRKSLS